MANIVLPVNDVPDSGLDDAAIYTGSLLTTNVYQVPNDGRILLHVKNAGASPAVVTFTPSPGAQIRGHALATISVSVTNGKQFFIAKLAASLYNDVNGLLNFAFSYITSVTIAVLRV